MSSVVTVSRLTKTYPDGLTALNGVDLEIVEGEILALLGPNGAGKTTLISTICGIASLSSGTITVGGHNIADDFRAARALIGLVPQEIRLEPFERVSNTVRFSRGLFGRPRNDARIEEVLRALALWDKRDSEIRALSGGMQRRVLIAKALAHDPRVLFLDEPTAGVDVELRREMWELVRRLKQDGVTIILTTHYIEEAEAIADRIAVISKGEILLVEEKDRLMARLGQKELTIELNAPIAQIPERLASYGLTRGRRDDTLVYTYSRQGDRTGITRLLNDLQAEGLKLRDVSTRESSLEEIFVGLVASGHDGEAP
ncbi:MAG: ABC transporter ATP-binding protein [Pseudomonadota bacterium]